MILDTTILIDFLRGEERAIRFVADHSPLWTTEVNVFELFVGAYLGGVVQKKKDNAGALIERLIVLPLDRKASIKAAELASELIKKGLTVETADNLIAGIALTNGITEIVTANKSHFERFDELKVISY
ncbi:type II toxin-antitoxin system VapC family toxin [Candidatus Woesearchaeota archaeon]|nr:type II toxin-antitoxin system VapC family toxin [Candidatus Woesearchaeota archaeon]